MPTTFGSLKTTGTLVAAGLATLASVTITSFVSNVNFDSASVPAPALTLDSTSFLKYQEDKLSASGSYHLTACVENPYTGKGTIHRVAYECDDMGNSNKVDIGFTASQSASGTDIVAARTASTGSLFNLSGATLLGLWENDKYICAATGTGTIVANHADCKLKVWSSQHYED